jgi:hypothetical protein
MKALGNDIHYGIRSLLKRPVFTVMAVVTLALGIGASTAIFSVMHTVLIRPLPYENSDRLVWLSNRNSTLSVSATFLNDAEYHVATDDHRVAGVLASRTARDESRSLGGAPLRIRKDGFLDFGPWSLVFGLGSLDS